MAKTKTALKVGLHARSLCLFPEAEKNHHTAKRGFETSAAWWKSSVRVCCSSTLLLKSVTYVACNLWQKLHLYSSEWIYLKLTRCDVRGHSEHCHWVNTVWVLLDKHVTGRWATCIPYRFPSMINNLLGASSGVKTLTWDWDLWKLDTWLGWPDKEKLGLRIGCGSNLLYSFTSL